MAQNRHFYTTDLIQLMQQQIMLQQQQMQQQNEQIQQQQMQMQQMLQKFSMEGMDNEATMAVANTSTTPSFQPFDAISELWTDYYAHFCTFVGAHAVQDRWQAQVFLTNQFATIYKLLANLAKQQSPPKDINELTLDEIVAFMKEQFDLRRSVIRERFKLWSDMNCTSQVKCYRNWQLAFIKMQLHVTSPQLETLRMRHFALVSFVQ